MTPEGKILADVIAFASKVPGLRLSRNSSGRMNAHGRNYSYGCFSPGGPDLLGWYRRETEYDRQWGIKRAIFTALEVKVPGKDATPEQAAFLKEVVDAGGIAGVVHSVEEAAALLGVEVRGG